MTFSIIYTNDIGYGLNRVVVIIPLLVIPITFFLVSSKESIDFLNLERFIQISFFASTVLFFIGVLIQNYYRGFINETIFTHYAERLNSKYGKYSMHPLYASMYVILSLVFAIPIYSIAKKTYQKVLMIISLLFLLLVLLLLARKGPIMLAFIIFLIYFIKFQNKKRILVYTLIVSLFFILITLIEPIRNRFVEFINIVLNVGYNHNGSTSIRLNVYECSFDAIIKKPFFGYGIGDVKTVLQQCYSFKEMSYFNSHNQFLSAWLSSGFLGVISLGLIFFNSFRLALKSSDFVFFSIIFLFFFMSMTENILERQDGVLLFAFFINFYVFKAVKQKQVNE
ncbi:O-antigen ligase family protein [Seonamhaeicola sp. NFXS20]|uniref:O-antigen ligase family protein n=1 Tax=Seonamhaeicola sp. NFXS20 TaxID=2816959 RepID=UPI003BA2A099